jgi:hypothetical protein
VGGIGILNGDIECDPGTEGEPLSSIVALGIHSVFSR